MVDSPIQEFYRNQTVLVTGATGFLGKQLVNKLLTSCSGVRKIYLLVREKKGKSAEDRLNAFLEGSCFDKVRTQFPNFRSKISIIRGDCELPHLGIGGSEEEILVQEVTCIIHVSATVRFDENLKIAAHINVRAVQDLIKLARKMQNLKAFVYVSTAYSNCNQKWDVEEKFYNPPMSCEELFNIVDGVEDDLVEENLENVLGEWPNTYTFTKAIAENVVKEEAKGLPIAVVRPAIVIGAVKEPEPGYFDTIQGISAVSIAVYVGLIRVVFMSKENRTFIVPSDYVSNLILAAGWFLHQERPTETPIYNFVGSHTNPITWNMYTNVALNIGRTIPSMVTMWWPFVILTDSKILYKTLTFLLHTMPAYLIDLVLVVRGKKTKAVKICKKVNKNLRLVIPFTFNTWNFATHNVDNLWNKMSEEDEQNFNFNMDSLDWIEYIKNMSYMVRMRILNDPLDTLPKAKRKHIMLGVTHYLSIILLVYLFYKLMYSVIGILYTF